MRKNGFLLCIVTMVIVLCSGNVVIAKVNAFEMMRDWAPLFYLHKDEVFYPSSVEWAFPHLKRVKVGGNYMLETREKLLSPSDITLPLFSGNHNLAKDPVYAFWTMNDEKEVTIIYCVFFPYRRGKFMPWAKWSYYGTQVGAWEYVILKFATENGKRVPKKIYWTTRKNRQTENLGGLDSADLDPDADPSSIKFFIAKGSHYINPNADRVKLCTGYRTGDVYDEFGDPETAIYWNTSDRIECYDLDKESGIGSGSMYGFGRLDRKLLILPNEYPKWMKYNWTSDGEGDPSIPGNGGIMYWGNRAQGSGIYQGKAVLKRSLGEKDNEDPISYDFWSDCSAVIGTPVMTGGEGPKFMFEIWKKANLF